MLGDDHHHKRTCLPDLGPLGQIERDGIERGLPGCIFVKAKEEKVGAGDPDDLVFRDRSRRYHIVAGFGAVCSCNFIDDTGRRLMRVGSNALVSGPAVAGEPLCERRGVIGRAGMSFAARRITERADHQARYRGRID